MPEIARDPEDKYFIIRNSDKQYIEVLERKNICLLKKTFEKLE